MGKKLSLKVSVADRIKERFTETIPHRMFETNVCFHVKLSITGKV